MPGTWLAGPEGEMSALPGPFLGNMRALGKCLPKLVSGNAGQNIQLLKSPCLLEIYTEIFTDEMIQSLGFASEQNVGGSG